MQCMVRVFMHAVVTRFVHDLTKLLLASAFALHVTWLACYWQGYTSSCNKCRCLAHLLVPPRVHAMDLPPAARTTSAPRAGAGAASAEEPKEPAQHMVCGRQLRVRLARTTGSR